MLLRYHTPSDSDILEQLLQQQRYNRRERPPIDGKIVIFSHFWYIIQDEKKMNILAQHL